jgi:predicted DNA-binding transcriptional regulator AlpA
MRTLIRPSDLARDLCVSRTWVYDAANTGRIPSIRIGGEEGPLRFVAEDVERWLDTARDAWKPGGPAIPTR